MLWSWNITLQRQVNEKQPPENEGHYDSKPGTVAERGQREGKDIVMGSGMAYKCTYMLT